MTTARYLVSHYWGHCFVGSREEIVRFAYDTHTDTLHAQVRRDGWQPLSGALLADVREDLDGNGVLSDPAAWMEVEAVAERPVWEEGLRVRSVRRPR